MTHNYRLFMMEMLTGKSQMQVINMTEHEMDVLAYGLQQVKVGWSIVIIRLD